MTRTILATATALVAATTFYTSAANACISCEYVPPVVRESSTLPHTGHYYVPPRSKSSYVAKSFDAPAKKRIVKSEPIAKKLDTAKVTKTETKNVAKTESKADAKVAKAEPADTKAVESESSSISVASVDAAETEKAPAAESKTEAAAAKPTDCKKFFASVGMTLTVPCE